MSKAISKKKDCQSLHVVLVRCYTHWFVPFMPKEDRRQAVFETEEEALKHAEKLVAMKGRYEEVVVMQG